MIEIVIQSKKGLFKSLTVSGHSGYEDEGKDIICAGISSVVIGGFNSIKDDKTLKMTVKKGFASCEAIGTINEHDEIVIETMVNGLKNIAITNKEFVKLIERKV